MKIGIIANLDKIDQVLPLFRDFSGWIADKGGVQLILERGLLLKLKEVGNGVTEAAGSSAELIKNSDLIITFGGDGTMLSTVRKIGAANTPILGFHLGKLGFLAQLTLDNYKEKLTQLLDGKYYIEERMLLQATVEKPQRKVNMFALNDIVISKGNTPRMIRFHITVDTNTMNRYNSDGIIIATPTGSTAYSLSASGPILTPDLNAVVINPICPHSLTNRPIVINADRRIEIIFTEIAAESHITADGQHFFPVDIHSKVLIKKADYTIKFIHFEGSDFFKILHSKLGWGV